MPRSDYLEGRVHPHRRRRAVPLAMVAASMAAGAVAGTSTDAWAGARGSSGTLVLKGFLSGTLKVPAFLPPGQILTGCQISPTQGGTVVLQWDKAKLNVNGHPKTLSNIDVQITVQSFGHRYSMTPNGYGEAPATVMFQSSMPFGWSSASGNLVTTKSGSAGSVSGTMEAGKQHPGSVTVKGNWAGCAKLT